jgi:hypothetical protein
MGRLVGLVHETQTKEHYAGVLQEQDCAFQPEKSIFVLATTS